MCGLTGLLSFSSGDQISNKVNKMNSLLSHRGPDGDGVWCEENIGLGHRRLSILDLSSSGAQPMHSDCRRYVLVFNGEIYNHLELRDSINSGGFSPKWRGHSDTETLLAAIVYWGLDKAISRLHGMFAFALWDRQKKTIFLTRDRLGEKPLYWGWAGKDIIFGSELKALRAHPDCSKKICKEALAQYLRFLYVPAPRCIHPGLYKIEPGTIVSIKNSPPTTPPDDPIRPGDSYGSISIHRYWDLNNLAKENSKSLIMDEKEAIHSLDEALGNAVKQQMISDVPLGAFLSGGVDSSAIVALMQAQTSKKVQTFTIGYHDPNFDESKHAAAVANHLGTNHTELIVTDSEAREVIPLLPYLYDEPFADSSQIPTYLVCKAAKNNVSVALSGDGGDELFGGYNRYIRGPSLWKKISKIPSPMAQFFSYIGLKIGEDSWDRVGEIYNKIYSGSSGVSNLGNKMHRLFERMPIAKNFRDFHLNIASTWTNPEDVILDDFDEPLSQFYDPLPISDKQNPAMLMMIQDMRTYLPDDILCKVDRASMGISLETRAPFLDPSVVSIATRIPTSMKIKDGEGKWVLRQVLYQYVPKNIIERPKAGFAIPVGDWLRGPLKDWAEDLLSPHRLAEDNLFKVAIIRKIWQDHLLDRRDWSSNLWAILMFQSWRSSLNE